jgi:hypothetical protein
MFWLGLLGGAGYGGWTIWQRQKATTPVAPPTWPPIDTTPSPAPAPASTFAAVATEPPADATSTSPRWVEPIDGNCPDGYPIKANDNSGIFHVPGGRFYDRTVPERCYANADDAVTDGYRAAKA